MKVAVNSWHTPDKAAKSSLDKFKAEAGVLQAYMLLQLACWTL